MALVLSPSPLLADLWRFQRARCSLVLFSLHHLFKLRYSLDGGPHQIQQQTGFRQARRPGALAVRRRLVLF